MLNSDLVVVTSAVPRDTVLRPVYFGMGSQTPKSVPPLGRGVLQFILGAFIHTYQRLWLSLPQWPGRSGRAIAFFSREAARQGSLG